VWALYSKGCRWLPARVVTVHHSENKGVSVCDSSFTVRYIMSSDEFKRAHTHTTTREFLPKPTPSLTHSSPPSVAVKPYRTESEVCGYVFDVVDESSEGVVRSTLLKKSLTHSSLSAVVNTSAALSLVVKSSAGLLDLLTEMFPSDCGSECTDEVCECGSGGGGVTKEEFVEFCAVAVSSGVVQ
jgi:hypothetical protein